MNPPPQSRAERIDALFAQYLAAYEEGCAVDWESLCAEHPAEADELRQREAQWRASSTLRQRLGPEPGGGGVSEGGEQLMAWLEAASPRRWPFVHRGEIGRGSFGVVSEVEESGLHRRLAMKTLRGSASEPGRLQRFLEEARVLAQLDHPGIASLYGVGLDEKGRPYITMRLVRGRDFSEIIRLVREERDGWNLTRALEVLLRVCDALAYAHAKGVVHRDLKPDNVRVGRFGETVVMDWGLARIVGEGPAADEGSQTLVQSGRTDPGRDSSELRTLEGDVLGTPSYMPPEQAAGRVEELGVGCDVYALGAILYHLLAGTPPYLRPGSRLSPAALVELVCYAPPTPLAELAPEAPPELLAVCAKAMARAPGDRYPSMRALADDLRAFLEHRVVRAHESGPWTYLWKWRRRHPLLAPLLVAAAVTALVFVPWRRGKVQAARSFELERAVELALLRGRPERARELLSEAGAREPILELRRAELELRAGERDAARSRLEALWSRAAAGPEAGSIALWLAWFEGSSPEAERWLERARSEPLGESELALARALAAVEPEVALAALEETLARDPLDYRAHSLLLTWSASTESAARFEERRGAFGRLFPDCELGTALAGLRRVADGGGGVPEADGLSPESYGFLAEVHREFGPSSWRALGADPDVALALRSILGSEQPGFLAELVPHPLLERAWKSLPEVLWALQRSDLEGALAEAEGSVRGWPAPLSRYLLGVARLRSARSAPGAGGSEALVQAAATLAAAAESEGPFPAARRAALYWWASLELELWKDRRRPMNEERLRAALEAALKGETDAIEGALYTEVAWALGDWRLALSHWIAGRDA